MGAVGYIGVVVSYLLDYLWIPCPLRACMIQLSWCIRAVVYMGAVVGYMVAVGGMWGTSRGAVG